MPVYEYKALDGSAKSTSGVIDAETPREAREKLRQKKIYVTDLTTVGEKSAPDPTKKPTFVSRLPLPKLGGGKRMAEVSQFTRQLSVLLRAGIPLTQSLNALVEQTQDRQMQTIIRDIRERVSSGTDLEAALAVHPDHFSSLFRSMVAAGQASGELDAVLGRVADFMQKQTRLRGKVSTALTYPAIMLFVSLAVVVFLLLFVVPQITVMMEKQDIEKPLPTLLVTGASDFMAQYWYLVIGGLFGMAGAFKWWKSTEKGEYSWHRFLLRAPLFGSLFTKTSVSRFATTFSVLLKSGLPALDSLRIVKEVVGNVALSKVIGQVHDSIVEGTDISTPIKKSGFFPPVVGYMISVGEQTGELENLLERIADAYDEEVDLAVQKLTAMIEPIMIVFMAVTVGTIIASVMLPLMEISSGGAR